MMDGRMRYRTGPAGPLAALLLLGIAAPPAAAALPSGIDVAGMDRSIRPGDDFDAFAAGRWSRDTPIPSDKSEIGTVADASDRVALQIRDLLTRDARSPAGRNARLIGSLYARYTGLKAIEAAGDRPLIRELGPLRAVTTKAGLGRLMGASNGGFGGTFFTGLVWSDQMKPDRNAMRIYQGGLGLGYPEAYSGPGAAERLHKYRAYVKRTLRLAGWAGAEAEAEAEAGSIVALETAIAKASWTTAQSSDRSKRYNPMSLPELEAFAPGFPWRDYVRGGGIDPASTMIVQQKSAFPKIAWLYRAAPLATLKAWAAFQTADQLSPYLPERFRTNHFSFHGKVEQGLARQPERWRTAVDFANDLVPDAVGREYVRAYFPEETKRKVEAMAVLFRQAMAARIRNAAWMDEETRRLALAKLERVRIMIGYPRSMRDYDPLDLSGADLVESVRRARAFNWAEDLRSLAAPVDQDLWARPPQVVDGFSDPTRVAVGITAGLLQPPFFDSSVDDAANFGAVGEAIGHELTHQFDDQGRKFDASGALANWWSKEDERKFEAAAAALSAQFSAIEVTPGVHLNGAQTLSENIADLGGLLLALDAYRLSLGGKPAPVIDGLTGDQRVFLGWARVFRNKMRTQALVDQVLGGTHTPFKYRIIMPMRNIDRWYEAFGIKPGDRYYLEPGARIRVW